MSKSKLQGLGFVSQVCGFNGDLEIRGDHEFNLRKKLAPFSSAYASLHGWDGR